MFESPIAKVIRTCLACRGKLGNFGTSHRELWRVAVLNQEMQTKLARELSIDPMTLRGLVMMCGYACNATDWLIYHGIPLTRESFQNLVDELRRRVSTDTEILHPLFHQLCWGAQEVLRLTDWGERRRDAAR